MPIEITIFSNNIFGKLVGFPVARRLLGYAALGADKRSFLVG